MPGTNDHDFAPRKSREKDVRNVEIFKPQNLSCMSHGQVVRLHGRPEAGKLEPEARGLILLHAAVGPHSWLQDATSFPISRYAGPLWVLTKLSQPKAFLVADSW